MVLSVLIAGACVVGACSSKSSQDQKTSTPAAATATPVANTDDAATRAAGSAAAKLASVLLVDGDVPADIIVRQKQPKILHAQDTPGLETGGSGEFITLVTDDKNEFVTEIGVIPDSGGAEPLLEAFTPANYLSGLTFGAVDAASTDFNAAGAPPGARAFAYSGTVVSTTGQSQKVEGQVVAFVQGAVFVLINHGTYAPSTRTIDVGALATRISQRLAATPSLN